MRVIVIVLTLSVIFLSSCGNTAKEEPQMPEGFPNDVYVKFIQMYPHAEISNYNANAGNNGLLFEVTASEDDETIIVLFTVEGAVLSDRRITPVGSDELPTIVVAAIDREYHRNVILSASKIDVNGVIEYQVVIQAKDNNEYRIMVSVEGEMKQQEQITPIE